MKNNQGNLNSFKTVYHDQGGGDEQYTPKSGNQPTFKASYFGVNFFKENIILADMNIK